MSLRVNGDCRLDLPSAGFYPRNIHIRMSGMMPRHLCLHMFSWWFQYIYIHIYIWLKSGKIRFMGFNWYSPINDIVLQTLSQLLWRKISTADRHPGVRANAHASTGKWLLKITHGIKDVKWDDGGLQQTEVCLSFTQETEQLLLSSR